MRSEGNCGGGDLGELHEPRKATYHGVSIPRAVGPMTIHRKNCKCDSCRHQRRLDRLNKEEAQAS